MIVAYDEYVYTYCCYVVGCTLLIAPLVIGLVAIIIDKIITIIKKVIGRKEHG